MTLDEASDQQWNYLSDEDAPKLRKAPALDDTPKWVVNDNAELGVEMGGRYYFLYKGQSLEYEDGKHDHGTQMYVRTVGKREFGECCHPINHNDYSQIGTVSLDDCDRWIPLPGRPEAPALDDYPDVETREWMDAPMGPYQDDKVEVAMASLVTAFRPDGGEYIPAEKLDAYLTEHKTTIREALKDSRLEYGGLQEHCWGLESDIKCLLESIEKKDAALAEKEKELAEALDFVRWHLARQDARDYVAANELVTEHPLYDAWIEVCQDKNFRDDFDIWWARKIVADKEAER